MISSFFLTVTVKEKFCSHKNVILNIKSILNHSSKAFITVETVFKAALPFFFPSEMKHWNYF